MNLKLSNTLTQKKEDFIPLKENEVSIYVCGVTLYDDIHIGHLKSILAFEVMRNYFEHKGNKVHFVRNITDVDDKIIAKAEKLNIDPLSLVNDYISKFHAILKKMDIRPPTNEPRVTEYLEQIGKYINDLKDKGFAYEAEDGVYFDTQVNQPERYPLSKKIVKDLENNTRLEKQDYAKRHKADFALWKEDRKYGYKNAVFAKQGRPGWHIECSVMHHHTLGEKFDIHGGGRDLIFPHHENEILQSEAHNGVNPANYWIHNGMMTKDGKKLSKSLGNSIYVKDILEKYSAEAIKIFLNKGQYNQSQEYNEDELKEAYMRWENFVSDIPKYKSTIVHSNMLIDDVIKALEDDFNTPLAISLLYAALRELKSINSLSLAEDILVVMKLLAIVSHDKNLSDIYDKWETSKNSGIPEIIIELANKRVEAKKDKNYILSDELRKEINQHGWNVKDLSNNEYSLNKIL
ncbi:cysteine--tRNA ligase [Shigella flexneri]